VKFLVASVAASALCVFHDAALGGEETGGAALGDLFQLAAPTAWTNDETLKILLHPHTNGSGKSQFFAGTNLFGMGTNLVPVFSWTNGLANSSPGTILSPGAYLSRPYACIVVAPDASRDAAIVIKPQGGINSKMPITEPKVTFVPWPEVRDKVASK